MVVLKKYQVLNLVHEKVPAARIDSMTKFIEGQGVVLWGESQPRGFLGDMVVLTLYKDLYHIGYLRLVNSVDFGYKITHISMENNSHRIRRQLQAWAMTQFNLGSPASWKANARHCGFKKDIADATLWMDSSDFAITGRKRIRKKSTEWSYKLNRPGRRYMVIRDGRGNICRVWGGYTPKLYDGDFLESHKNEIERDFANGVILADNHFSRGKKIFKKVKFLTNFAMRQKKTENKEDRDHQDDFVEEEVATAKRSFNEQHRQARARVETPFGWIKGKFRCLNEPWAETDEQLDCVVYLALALYTKRGLLA